MTVAVEIAEKTCTKCGEIKPLSEFHRRRQSADGRQSQCAECVRSYINERNAVLRSADPERFRYEKAKAVDRFRRRTGDPRGKKYGAARRAAISDLIEAHRDEFEHRLRIKKHEAGLL